MITLRNIIVKLILGTFLIVGINSCDEGGEPDPGSTLVVEMAGDWYVKAYDESGTNALTGFSLFSTYNTSDNDSSLWLDDHEGIFPLKSKVAVDLNAMTFSASDAENLFDAAGIATVTEGKILKKATTSTGGNVVDSIAFKVTLQNDPGNVYLIGGYKRTGLLEDEH
ncbi:lipid-binding protein [Flavivirga abyssicola]|uniref:lipid-binding protein n=1 Tax=Flavivirga abyssicola TaxID=3063533 RepID=UPI0026E06BE3|nr:lipid-binding protein [Flavivirga sp. MEBiC07777]WVK11834.1 lipid-binding protein [Flavivirga sp. MEBiC07777]